MCVTMFKAIWSLFALLPLIALSDGYELEDDAPGQPAALGEYPFVASIQRIVEYQDYYDDDENGTIFHYRHQCAGTILNDKFILTTKEALKSMFDGGARLRVVAGSLTTSENSSTSTQQIRNVANVFFNATMHATLVEVDEAFQFGPEVAAVVVARAGDSGIFHESQTCFSVGWNLHIRQDHKPRLLRWINVTPITNDECSSLLKERTVDGDLPVDLLKPIICGGIKYGGQLTPQCFDTHGPLICKGNDGSMKLFGMSGNPVACDPAKRVVDAYMSVVPLLDWIHKIAGTIKYSSEDV
ncbi:unnamed protein product [Cyprideis torosa]|uniref:Uncharacterized protein n=1 Tax=Cyprideis torosa TaxID=163714 RepID=A0A7R8WIB0_9CRUS|nr:unnamed protein product [Cyprideis torosa]CAG0898563.1 unnamed protein product [Cyprideis torosa]